MIKHTLPPNYKEIQKHFPSANFYTGTVFTYFPDIYIKGHIYEDLLVHEQTHLKQQNSLFQTPEKWWKQYYTSPKFRLEQEIEAYHNQYKCKPSLLNILARDLCSPLYGGIVTYKQAEALIKHA